MHISTLFISVLSLAVCLRAASLQPLFLRVPVVSAASIGQEFTRRQISIGSPSSVPSQCTSTCSPVNNEISLNCPVTACCTTTFETQYYNCLECVGMALHAANYSTAQNSLDLLYTTCVDMGFVLPRLELPGQTPSNSSSTGSASATALFPTGSSGVTPATGAAVGGTWHGVRAEALIGAAVLLWVAGLW